MNKKEDTSRREFLRGQIFSSPAGEHDTAGESESNEVAQGNPSIQAEYLQHFAKRAMACDFEVFFNLNQYDQAAEATLAAFQLIDQLEDQLSYYRKGSEISRINGSTGELIEISAEVREILQQAEILYRETDGAFDITSTPLSNTWGFHRRQAALPTQDDIDSALQFVGASQLKLSPGGVRLCQRGIEINLNSIGKGYTLERAADLISGFHAFDFIIHGGQSSVVARGSELVNEPKVTAQELTGWKVGLSHPFVPNQRLAEITLKNKSLGTSGTARQGFYHQGKRYGHVIDPRTGWPTDHFLSTTVICNSAARSDALATAFFVMSLEEVETYCDSHTDVAAIVVVPKSNSGAVNIETFNAGEGLIRFE